MKALNVIRRFEFVAELLRFARDVLFFYGDDLPERIAAATEKIRISMVLDGVGGSATQRQHFDTPHWQII